MDLTNRGSQPPQTNNFNTPLAHAPGPKKPGRLHRIRNHRLLNATYLTLLFSLTILIVGVVLLIFLFDGGKKEEKLVDTGKYQAVFLNGGQVYFGKVADINSSYLSLVNIYYLTPNQAVQTDNKSSNNNFTIRKLGCELHRPQDAMVISRDQIIFWENLKDDDSQNTVPGAIKELAKQPQNCDQQSQSNTSNSPSTSSTPTTDNGSSGSNSTDTTSGQ
ncbi:MAG TPA: hypothetical protein VFK11_04060 [Candidatus Saccharimonadales bacterium]|nr:hypothetical protein [Candidatus Saccharimonadales bacterium]